MINYEERLFEVAPWTKEVMRVAKSLNGGSFLRGREGWILRKVKNPESIYEHSCKVALAAHYLFGTEEAISEGLCHDFPEIIEPDHLPPEIDPKAISPEEKQRKEYAAMKKICSDLPNGEYWFAAWKRYENKKGTGKYVAELDKMCPAIQGVNYQNERNGHRIEEFYPYARKKISTPQLIQVLDDTVASAIGTDGDAYDVYFRKLAEVDLTKSK